MTFLEAAIAILQREGRPLHFKKLTEIALQDNLLTVVGRTPEVTMQQRLNEALKKEDPSLVLTREKPGVFGLRQYPKRADATAPGEAAAAAAPSSSATEKAAAPAADGVASEASSGSAEGGATERRRRRRGGRGRRRRDEAGGAQAATGASGEAEDDEAGPDGAGAEEPAVEGEARAVAASTSATPAAAAPADTGDEGGPARRSMPQLPARPSVARSLKPRRW